MMAIKKVKNMNAATINRIACIVTKILNRKIRSNIYAKCMVKMLVKVRLKVLK